MIAAARRLLLGLALIAGCSALLLLTDRRRRLDDETALPRVALLQHIAIKLFDEVAAGVGVGIADAGLVEDRDFELRRYNAGGDLPTANTLAQEIVGSDFDLVITLGMGSLQAMANANPDGSVRHVFGMVTDPLVAGVGITGYEPQDHPPWMTGYGSAQPVDKLFRTVLRLAPDLPAIGVPWNPSESNSEWAMRIARRTCDDLGVELLEATVDTSAGVKEAVSSLLARGARAIYIGPDGTVNSAVGVVIGLGQEERFGVFTHDTNAVAQGATLALGADWAEIGRQVGLLAARVLRGEDPATIPVSDLLPEALVIDQARLVSLEPTWRLDAETLRAARLAR